jgi:uncharacterized membrane protein YuzA (DUF378 family)
VDKETKKILHMAAFVLTVVGALNWGLVGLLNVNLVAMVLGAWPGLVNLVYILVGVAAAYLAATHMGDCMWCSGKKK